MPVQFRFPTGRGTLTLTSLPYSIMAFRSHLERLMDILPSDPDSGNVDDICMEPIVPDDPARVRNRGGSPLNDDDLAKLRGLLLDP